MNNKLIAAGLFCDLEKALDFVNHDMLLTKLALWDSRDF
jgi:hypothetical protein